MNILIRHLGPNGLNKEAIDRYCKVLARNKEIMDNFDQMCVISKRSGAHTSCSTDSYMRKIVKELVEYKALHYQNGRSYTHFANVKDSLLEDLEWIFLSGYHFLRG